MNKDIKMIMILVAVSFLLGSNEFLVLGISSVLSHDFNVSTNQIGLLTTVYSIVYAAFIVILVPLTARLHNFKRLLWLITIFAVSNLFTAISTSYVIFAIARITSATIVGTINALLIAFANKIAPKGKENSFLISVFTGISLSSVLGVPIYSYLTNITSWRIIFILIATLTMLSLSVLRANLPRWEGEKNTLIRQQYKVFRDTNILLGIAVTSMSVAALYSFYTYLEPFLRSELHLQTAGVSVALGAFGTMSLASNHISGIIQSKYRLSSFPRILIVIIVFLMLGLLAQNHHGIELIVVVFIGSVLYLVGTPSTIMFMDFARATHPQSDIMGASLYPVAFNVGIALGSVTGGAMIQKMQFSGMFLSGISWGTVGLVLSILLIKRQSV